MPDVETSERWVIEEWEYDDGDGMIYFKTETMDGFTSDGSLMKVVGRRILPSSQG